MDPVTSTILTNIATDRIDAAEEAHSPRVFIGRVWEVMGVSRPFLEALERAGMARYVAAWVLMRRMIVLGAGESRYDHYRTALRDVLEEG